MTLLLSTFIVGCGATAEEKEKEMSNLIASSSKPFIYKTLNYAFSSPEGIQLWVKK
jgi:hypothetical protein